MRREKTNQFFDTIELKAPADVCVDAIFFGYKDSMSDAMTIAAAGMVQTMTQFNTDAARTVAAASQRSADDGELTQGIAAQVTDKAAFEANAATFKTAGKMLGTLLDTVA
jgi:hypothetical protein